MKICEEWLDPALLLYLRLAVDQFKEDHFGFDQSHGRITSQSVVVRPRYCKVIGQTYNNI